MRFYARPALLVIDELLVRTTPPDYKSRGLSLSVRSRLLRRRDRVVLADWVDTGAQASAVRTLVGDAGAVMLRVAAAVDGSSPEVRGRLSVRSLLHERALSG